MWTKSEWLSTNLILPDDFEVLTRDDSLEDGVGFWGCKENE